MLLTLIHSIEGVSSYTTDEHGNETVDPSLVKYRGCGFMANAGGLRTLTWTTGEGPSVPSALYGVQEYEPSWLSST